MQRRGTGKWEEWECGNDGDVPARRSRDFADVVVAGFARGIMGGTGRRDVPAIFLGRRVIFYSQGGYFA